MLYIWSLYTPLEFQFHAISLDLEVNICFKFNLLASLISFFLLFIMNIMESSSTCDSTAFGSSCACQFNLFTVLLTSPSSSNSYLCFPFPPIDRMIIILSKSWLVEHWTLKVPLSSQHLYLLFLSLLKEGEW